MNPLHISISLRGCFLGVKQMNPLVCIILVNYNTLNDTKECVESLRSIAYDNYKIIVVDNHSRDAVRIVSDTFLNTYCDVIVAEKNGGFAYGNNRGIEYAEMKYHPEYFLLLNNDTVVKSDFLNEMVNTALQQDRKECFVSGRVNYYSDRNKADYRGGYYDYKRGLGLYYNVLSERINERISFATGCLILISANALKKVGLLDESYFMYSEDTEYSLRANKIGIPIFYNDNAVIYHKISASCGKNSYFNQYYITRNDLQNVKRYCENKFLVYLYHLAKDLKLLLLRNKDFYPTICAWIDFLAGRNGKSSRKL